MSDLSDFGGGVAPEKSAEKVAHDSRGDRAAHRRETYNYGRCRAISTAKGCRCGGGVIEGSPGEFCYYHGLEEDSPASQLVTIDDEPDILARWCGLRPTEWDEIPEPCRAALENERG
jgi:hypothetical protein